MRGILKSFLLLVFSFSIQSIQAQQHLKPNVTSTTPKVEENDADEDSPSVRLDEEKGGLHGEVDAEKKSGFFVEYFNYEEYAYSRSRKTEIGDQVELDVSLRYQYSPSTFGRFRFLTDPEENRFDNKTSKFEFLAGHVYNDFYFQIDSELLTNDGSSGGISIGMDLDSEETLIAYKISEPLLFTFYPFNFDGEVGHEFNTWDVTRIYFVDGAPTTIATSPVGDEKIAEKTLGGFELTWKANPHKSEGLIISTGVGAATYQYPGNSDFDIEQDGPAPSTSRWERREDFGYRFGLFYRLENFRFEGKYVGHTKDDETGSLLQSAGSLYSIVDTGSLLLEGEVTMSQAGSKPYRLDKESSWFEQTSPWQPVYKDVAGNRQDWIGKTDYAYALKAGVKWGDIVPYVLYRHQGGYFIFRERESAHRLRTADESASHGGLNRVGFGSYIYSGNIVVNPEFEYLMARNPVFSNAGDVRNDRQFASFVKEDFLVYLIVRYQFDGPKLFQP